MLTEDINRSSGCLALILLLRRFKYLMFFKIVISIIQIQLGELKSILDTNRITKQADFLFAKSIQM
jgi:uncharacterized protein YqgQ